MAATEVIRFRFDTQAVHAVRFSTLNPTFLFEHSPPAPNPLHPFSRFDPFSHFAGIRVSRHLANRSAAPALIAGGKEDCNAKGPSVRGNSLGEPRAR